MRVEAFGQSQQGLARAENQDSVGLDHARRLFVVSDGMGGHAEGARASREVVAAMLAPRDLTLTRPISDLARLKQQVHDSHQRVLAVARELGHEGDMGATLVVLWLNGENYRLAAVGDSRIYLWREGRLLQLNEDHTLARHYLRTGVLNQEEAANHPQRHVLTQAMGVGQVEPDLFEGAARPGDRFLLCSDGVHGVLPEGEITALLGKAPSAKVAVEALLARVRQLAGGDDATALVAEVGQVAEPETKPEPQEPPKSQGGLKATRLRKV
ncbi:MAG: protein phosphatase 2C domain-containing protein [Deltaproteobacteria bacterium]|nr:protein phosphatase 2C domain-containing protein [Deltaproteobacteria bacterium]MCB2186351.1 protein phosphatase 2C domain-containing protein [Deltaproteobacteria bacterium]